MHKIADYVILFSAPSGRGQAYPWWETTWEDVIEFAPRHAADLAQEWGEGPVSWTIETLD